jgi:hypothetical protein
VLRLDVDGTDLQRHAARSRARASRNDVSESNDAIGRSLPLYCPRGGKRGQLDGAGPLEQPREPVEVCDSRQ